MERVCSLSHFLTTTTTITIITTTMFICSTCSLQFDLRGVYSAHIRKCISISTFTTHAGQQVTVKRNEKGVFLCYCSHPGCPKPTGYLTTDSMKNHIKKVQSTWIGPNNDKQSTQLEVNLCTHQHTHIRICLANSFLLFQTLSSTSLNIGESSDTIMQSPTPSAVHSPHLMMMTSPKPSSNVSPFCTVDNAHPVHYKFTYTYAHDQLQDIRMQSPEFISPKSPLPLQPMLSLMVRLPCPYWG